MKASIIIPTYNRGASVLKTIESVISQDYFPMEVIVVDDGSTDNTKEILQPFVETKKIQLVEEEHRGKPSPARNRGLEIATGDVIFLFDSDDIMLPGKIRITMDAFKLSKSHNIGFCCTDFFLLREGGSRERHLTRAYYKVFQEAKRERLSEQAYILNNKESYRSLLAANFVGTSSVALPKSVVQAGFRFDESFTNSDDYDMWLRIARDHEVLIIDQPLHEYIVNSGGVLKNSIRTGEKWRTHIKMFKRELQTIQDSQCRATAYKKLSESYRALTQSEIDHGRWGAAAFETIEAFKADPSSTASWIWRRLLRRIRRLGGLR